MVPVWVLWETDSKLGLVFGCAKGKSLAAAALQSWRNSGAEGGGQSTGGQALQPWLIPWRALDWDGLSVIFSVGME